MTTHVIVLNGGSSSGKNTLAAELQRILPEPWLSLSVDTFCDALPARMTDGDAAGISIGDDGTVGVGAEFSRLEQCWAHGVAAMARAGAHVVVDDVFLGGPASQQRWRTALEGLGVLWVGVHCAPEVAARRERARGDRQAGMAEQQALAVHRGIDYDVEVDTTHASAAQAVRPVLRCLHDRARTATGDAAPEGVVQTGPSS
jgi:chloramphenicol 3-O phosphotransferase